MEFLSGFRWPVPRAFAAAVAAGRFEQGDLLYDTPAAYEAWESAAADTPGCWVQVLDPPRSARSAPAEVEGNRFAANWASPVTVEIGTLGSEGPNEVSATQGRLFTCLWRGERDWLVEVEPGAGADPPLPSGARELQQALLAAVPALRKALAARAEELLFVLVEDESSEASRAKARAVEAALCAGDSRARAASLSPTEAEVPGGDAFHPSLRICATALRERDPEVVRTLLKPVLYTPTLSRKAGGDGSSSDRFKLERHGLLDAGPGGD